MKWNIAILTLKAKTGCNTDKELYEPAGMIYRTFNRIKTGKATFNSIERLCSHWAVMPSEFIEWGEK